MAHILILRAKQNDELSHIMFKAASEVIGASGHTYDEILIPTAKELPIALNMFAESLNYEATICIGAIMRNDIFEDSKIHYQEILRNIYDYSSYFGHLVGNCITYHNSAEVNNEELFAYARETVAGICELIKVIREINSMESSRYAGSTKHN